MADTPNDKISSFKRTLSLSVKSSTTDTKEEVPEPVIDVLPTPTSAEVEDVFDKELQAMSAQKEA
eukprot:CAMPEP_0175072298 /NCGR_PEP_ID=MMETSP0052_2-20121109/19816_1 /TAXON_ID=51329 ORGANISM="Polytomella parva, Strain SAG 63-3" /NCGR_SAMPLE_ID=MMETSP0052_2 /ASSEMBLY_ACC=CAM_ASM_000194 /LENGTH=64 /DNA_ID=CAMNT_0016339755 /DNA_START=11 /DNA_END=205 /DNA_ORIENTATION=-